MDARGPRGGQEQQFGGKAIVIEENAEKGKVPVGTKKEEPKKATLFQKLDVTGRLRQKKAAAAPGADLAAEFDRRVARNLDILGLVSQQFEDRLSFFRLCKTGATAGTL